MLRVLQFVLLAVGSFCALALTGCAETSPELPAAVIDKFNIQGNDIADLTDGSTERVPQEFLLQSVNRAKALGTDLRVVVAGPDDEFISARSVVDRYGGTAVAYKAGATTFEGASRDISADQLDRAVNAAKLNFDIGDSADAFVDVLEVEGLELRSPGGIRKFLPWLVIPAAAFMLWSAYAYWSARNRRAKRQSEFTHRKEILIDWAQQLEPDLESLRPMVAASPDNQAQTVWHEASEFVSNIGPTLRAARTTGELDAAEMRISRNAIKLRDLRQSLDQ